jgi:hypothetical protein
VLVEDVGELAEVCGVAGVGDAPVDLLAGRLESAAGGGAGSSEQRQREQAEESDRERGPRVSGAGQQRSHAGKREASAPGPEEGVQAPLRWTDSFTPLILTSW